MAYEFIATGITPATPIKSFLDSYSAAQETKQNQEIDKVNAEAGQNRNELADIQLQDARTQVEAEKALGQLPRMEDGTLNIKTPEFKEFMKLYPKQADVQMKDAYGRELDKFTLFAKALETGSTLFKNAHTPEQIKEAQNFGKQWGIDIQNPETFTHASVSVNELGQKIEQQMTDYKNLIAAGKYEEAQQVKESMEAEARLSRLDVQLREAQIAASKAAAAASRAKINSGVDPGPLEKFLDENGNPVIGTRQEAIGKRPIPPAPSLKDELEQGKVEDAKKRVSGNLDALNDYYTELDALGAAVDVNKTSGANLSASVRASGPGQLAGKALGTKEQSVRNQINQMRPLLLQEIRQASAMGVKGLDSNKELDFYLQAATDPARDIQANIAALNVLSKAYGLGTTYKEQNSEKIGDLHNEFMTALPLVRNDDDYQKLAPGTEYRDVYGKRGKKVK